MDSENGKVIQFHPSIPPHPRLYISLVPPPPFLMRLYPHPVPHSLPVAHPVEACLWRSPTATSRRAGTHTAHPGAPPPGP